MASLNASLAVFLPYNFSGGPVKDRAARSFVCALLLAFQHVHTRNTSIVPELTNLTRDVNFTYQLLGTEASAAVAVNHAIDFLVESRALADDVPRAMLGPAWSALAKPMALMAGAEEVPMVSYWAASPKLSTLPYFTRTFPSDSTAGRLLVHLLYNGSVFKDWNHVAVVYQDDEWGQGYVAQMKLEFKRLIASKPDAEREPPLLSADTDTDSSALEKVSKYRTLRTFSFAVESGSIEADKRRSVNLALDAVKDTGASVIVVVALGPSFVNILEEANETGLVTPQHAWLIADGKGVALPEIDKLPIERRTRVSSLISGMQSFEAAARLQPGWTRFLRAWASMTPAQCANSIFEPDANLFAAPPYEPSAYLYDGVVALALAMDAVAANDTAGQGQGQGSVGAKLLKELKKRVRFDGASGPIDLDDVTGDREPATLQFALESFDDTLSEKPMILAYSVRANNLRLDDGTTEIECVATRKGELQWIGPVIGGKGQPEDAITRKLLDDFEEEKRKAEQEAQDAAGRNRIMVIGAVVGVLVAIIATLGVTICWVRVRRVADLYEVSPWQLIRDRTVAKARAIRFVFVKVHRRWLKLRSAGGFRVYSSIDDDDARDVRGNALLVAAGWRTGLHAPLSIWGLRDQFTGAGKAMAIMGEATAAEVQVEVRPDTSRLSGGESTGGGDESTCGSVGGDSSNSGTGGRASFRGMSGRLSRVARGEVADPVTRRLLTACNTDWRMQPNAIDVCKAPTAAQVQANLLDLEFNLPHFCSLFRKYAEAEILLDSASGRGDGNGGGSGGDNRHGGGGSGGDNRHGGGGSGSESRMFPGLRMTEDGWLRFQSVEQFQHNAVEQLKLFRAAANRRHKTSSSATSTGLLPRAASQRRPRDEAKPENYLYQAKPNAVIHSGAFRSVVIAGSNSLTFVEFVKLLLSPVNRALDPAALVPEEGHADAPLTHFWIATSHNSYAVGHQLTGYADEAMYRRQLLQGCRSLEIDCWNGARGEPVVTHGNTLVNKISFASVAKAVAETAFVTSQAPVLLSLEMHCDVKQQARIAEQLKKELGALLLTCADLENLVEAQSTVEASTVEAQSSSRASLGSFFGEQLSERELPFQALQGRVLIKAKVPQLTPVDVEESRVSIEPRESVQGVVSSLPSKRPNAKANAKGGSKGVTDPSLRALVTMPSVPAAHFMTGKLPPGVHGLPISSLSEPLLQSIFAAAGEDLRAEAAAKVQRITRGWQARGFPRGTRIKSDNADPLFQWGMGVQQVALNLQTNDTPTQLHHALFALGGGCGYVLKPREMRAEPPETWPPARATLHRATITLLSLHQLPAPDEERPALARGHRRACHTCVPELSGEYTGPSVSSVSSPSVSIELHPIGGYCRVATALPPSPGAGRSHTTQAVEKSGFNACFVNELPVHCLAAEPRETLLRVGVWDHGTLVAYDTLVLGALRAGHRCIQLRSRLGTRLELCHLFVHVELGEEVNTGASSVELREELQKEKALVQGLRSELRARRARHPEEDDDAQGSEEERPLLV